MSVSRRGFVRILVAAGLGALLAGGAVAETPGDSLAELERTTREYTESLAHLLALHEADEARTSAVVERYRALLADGLVSRRDVETVENANARARAKVMDTRERIAEADQTLVEARALARLATLPPIAPGQERETPEIVEYHGTRKWTLADTTSLERFFERRFGRALPVSARGQTPVHDRLGFDHRNALDVAVSPDSAEGRALLAHLRAQGVPYLAFRGAVAGASTGAHVHVGAPSPRRG